MAIFGPRVGHEALFDEVCRHYGIDRKTKAVLQLVSKKYHMQRPAEIFIEPDTLTRALGDTDFSEEEHSTLKKLHDDWFTDKPRGRSR